MCNSIFVQSPPRVYEVLLGNYSVARQRARDVESPRRQRRHVDVVRVRQPLFQHLPVVKDRVVADDRLDKVGGDGAGAAADYHEGVLYAKKEGETLIFLPPLPFSPIAQELLEREQV